MDIAIAVLAAACVAVFGLLAWLMLSWRHEQRAEDRQARDLAAAPRSQMSLITGGRPGRLCGGPDHPDWPLPPRR